MSPEEKGPSNERSKEIQEALEKNPKGNVYVGGLKTRMENKGVSLEEAFAEARKEIEVSKEYDSEYLNQLMSLEAAYEYLKSQGIK